jgi:hypothetical protein
MCDCKITWVKNPEIHGTHNMTPVTCSEYIEALEGALGAVNPQILTYLHQEFGLETDAEKAPTA